MEQVCNKISSYEQRNTTQRNTTQHTTTQPPQRNALQHNIVRLSLTLFLGHHVFLDQHEGFNRLFLLMSLNSGFTGDQDASGLETPRGGDEDFIIIERQEKESDSGDEEEEEGEDEKEEEEKEDDKEQWEMLDIEFPQNGNSTDKH